MPGNVYTLSDVFKQLGLPSDTASIADFIARNTGACEGCGLCRAPIWTESQRAFLKEALNDDSDWAIPVEQLGGLLSECGPKQGLQD